MKEMGYLIYHAFAIQFCVVILCMRVVWSMYLRIKPKFRQVVNNILRSQCRTVLPWGSTVVHETPLQYMVMQCGDTWWRSRYQCLLRLQKYQTPRTPPSSSYANATKPPQKNQGRQISSGRKIGRSHSEIVAPQNLSSPIWPRAGAIKWLPRFFARYA